MESPDEPRTLTSAFESPTFGENSSFKVEQPVGAASISPCGRDVVLASKEGLHIIDLDTPYSPPRYLPHHTPWEVADVQWSPFGSRDHWVVSTSNQKALVWNLALASWHDPIEHVLHAHDRAITDINFSAHHPDILATCAVDSFVHCWDLRIPARPVVSFSDWFAGATQVKWNRQDSHVIASAHDRCLRIWDDRMGVIPLKSIVAHDTKIYGIDWNRVRPMAIATCSLDKSIKLWDCDSQTDEPEKVIRTPFPVWRARHTPFGWGMLAMPQRGNHDLHLYDRRAEPGSISESAHVFPGHRGQVKEFLWRARGNVVDGTDQREFQLVTWGADKELRLHRVTDDVLKSIAYEKGGKAANFAVTRKDAKYRTFRDEPAEQPDYFDSQSAISPGPSQSLHFRPRGSFSIGMSKVSNPRARGWAHGNRGPRIGMNAKTSVRQDMNPIAWMRGVKVTGWDEDALEQEITQVGEMFSKVVFEAVDPRQRRATIMLHGPWAQDGQNIFIKVDIKFPSAYPRGAAPTFNVQRTALVKDQLATNIATELKKIANTYLVHKKGCLEAIIRYLLGESSLQDTIDWIEKTDDANKLPVDETLDEDSSSDEDVDGVGGEFQGPDLSMSDSELFRPVNLNVMVPVAKACGAFWAPNGQLVCFFPPKKEKTESFLDTLLGLRDLGTSRSDRAIFEGFGRLQTRSPGPKPPGGTVTTGGDEAASDSDESYASSSSSSGSTDLLHSLPAQFQAPQAWHGGNVSMRRPRSTDHSQRSVTQATTKSALDAPKSIISIRNFSDLLPAKRVLAQEYRVSGEPSEVCAHNAEIAAKHGNHDLARVWGLMRLVLQGKVPLETRLKLKQTKDIYEVARQTLRRRDSGVDLSFDALEEANKLNSRVQWGASPLGGRQLVPALFDYFERMGDVQMLAMLSCVFHETGPQDTLEWDSGLGQNSAAHEGNSILPTLTITKRLLGHELPASREPPPIRTRFDRQGSRNSETWNATSDSPTTFAVDHTPPWPLASDRSGTSGSAIHAMSVSESPEYRFLRHSNSNLANFASSFTRGLSLGGASMSVSPETHGMRKRASPSSSLSGIPSIHSAAWGSNTRSSKSYVIPENTATSVTRPITLRSPPSENERVNPVLSEKKSKTISVTFKNRNKFDHYAVSHVPLLDSRRNWQYSAYRAAYASLLSNWRLPITMSEILKYDGLQHASASAIEISHPQPVERRRSSMSAISHHHKMQHQQGAQHTDESSPLVDPYIGLGFQRSCLRCAAPLPQTNSWNTAVIASTNLPIFLDGLKLSDSTVSSSGNGPNNNNNSTNPSNTTSKTECANCKVTARVPPQIPCVICGEFALGVMVPCLECGHSSCLMCYQAWFGVGDDEEQRECPGGCGCECTTHSTLEAGVLAEPPMAKIRKER